MTTGLSLDHRGHTVRLKWHRLRRRMRDPIFCAETMVEGFALGASMELDLRVRGDGGFVVLHDASLEGETTGKGVISQMDAAEMDGVCYANTSRPLTFSEDLSKMLKATHPNALLQFDMKDDLAGVGEAGLAHLERHFSDISASVIISAGSLELIAAVHDRIPSVLRGIDPTNKLVDVFRRDGMVAMEAELIAALRGETEPDTVYLAWQLVLEASRNGLDLIGLCHAEGRLVDAWTFKMKNPDAGFDAQEWDDFSALVDLLPDQITIDEAIMVEKEWLKRH